MDLVIFPKEELLVVLRALRTVASANDAFTDDEAALVRGVARLHGVEIDPRRIEPIAPEEVKRVVVDAHRRKRAVQLALVMSLVEGPPTASTEAAVRALANALDIPEPGVEVLSDIARGHILLARIDMMRRMRRFATNGEGLRGIFKMVAPLIGFDEPEVAARYRALERCAPGTLGRAIFDHYQDNGFNFPGDHIPARIAFHDIGHVLSGYGVDPQGEIQQAAFQAGFVREDGFLFLLFGILQFHLGMRLTPVARGEKGFFDVDLVLRALARGAKCKVDLSREYDALEHADEPLSEVRARLGVEPLAAEA
ncbi:MAG: hypothetical protein U0359_29895 [Byssovorax sp.]